MQIRTILHPTDFSELSEAALPHALWFAEEFGADLHLLHAVVLHAADPANPELAFPNLDGAYGEIEEWAEARLQAATPEVEHPEVRVRQFRERGISAAPVILEHVDDHQVDLVVMGTHGRRGLRRMLLGSVTEEVLRSVPCPVLTVRGGDREHGEPPERILAPIDFSESSGSGLRWAGELAGRTGAELHVFHVVNEFAYPDPYFAQAANLRAMGKAAQEHVPEAMKRRVAEVLGGDAADAAKIHMQAGPPAQTIADFVEDRDVGMVVMGSHGRSGVERAFLGSVAEGVVRRSACPVLIVRE